MVSHITNCRICSSTELLDVIDLGEQLITSRFPVKGDFSTPKCAMTLCMCGQCGLLQLRQTTASADLYEQEYGYRSGISNTMRTHLYNYHKELILKAEPKQGDTVLDIGCNDATFLKFYEQHGLQRVGMDPTGEQFRIYYRDTDIQLLPTYFSASAFRQQFPTKKCKVVSSIAMFYDLPDPVGFAKDIHEILDDDGIWTCEQSYLISMLDTNSIDTICHEHLEYYCLSQIKEIADRANLKIVDVGFNDSNGGSFRVYMAKNTSKKHMECTDKLESILETEKEYGISNPDTYFKFFERCKDQARRLKMLVDAVNSSGKKMWVYGASTKGNCTLQFANLTNKDTEFAVERNPKKFGKMTPTGVEIISEQKMRESPPEYLLVLPWHFRKEIIQREQAFLENGGTLVFPFPKLDLVALKQRFLVTGCDGHIASYFLDEYSGRYDCYGITREQNIPIHHDLTRFQFDMNNEDKLRDAILTIRPDCIVHLAGISRSQEALENPLEALRSNGMMTAVICDCLHKNELIHTKIFHASSSEIYKGHGVYTVQDDDRFFNHIHPYSIAKVMGHSIIDFYRVHHNLPFSNGILFTTESVRKSPDFLMNKVAQHASQWWDKHDVLHLGSLDSQRNVIHASDTARAIDAILGQEKGNNYILCGDASYSVQHIVFTIYEKFGILLHRRGDGYVEKNTGKLVLMLQRSHSRGEAINDIKGHNSRLRSIGWSPIHTLDDIIQELYDTYHKEQEEEEAADES